MPEIGPVKGAGQVVAPSARRVDAFIADVRYRPSRDELSFVRFARRGAGDGNVASPLPALMPLTELVPIPAPGEVAQVRAIVPDQVDVRAQPADELFQPAIGCNGIPVIFLDHDVVGSHGVRLTRVLRVHVAPGGTVKDQPHGWLFELEDEQTPGCLCALAVPEESRDGDAPAIG